jgi:hypothetical protein
MTIPSPLFRDPVYDGAADPTVIWNREEKTWWMLYTNRRANVEGQGVAWAHGTDIGIASSTDGQSWLYRGTLAGLEFERGGNTFWAPEVIWHEGLYHMYVSYVRGVPTEWRGGRNIVHMVSKNLWDWQYQSILPLSSERVIDACVYHLPGGAWQLWYKDEDHHSHTYSASSSDLWHWQVDGPVIADCAHEGPNAFFWRGAYWMITDPWRGLDVYRSEDCRHWTRQDTILDLPGTRVDDGAIGHHADVLVQGEKAFIFYFTHPEVAGMAAEDFVWTYGARRTSLHAAQLEFEAGRLACDRDRAFDLNLLPGVES